jgi:hypothetical protein
MDFCVFTKLIRIATSFEKLLEMLLPVALEAVWLVQHGSILRVLGPVWFQLVKV